MIKLRENTVIITMIVFAIIVCFFFLYLSPTKKEMTILDEPKLSDQKALQEDTIIINEVSIYPKEAIELRNLSKEDLVLDGYQIIDKSKKEYTFKNEKIKAGGYLVLDSQQLGFNINSSNEVITLKKGKDVIDEFKVGKLTSNVSVGINNGERVYYKDITLGKNNSSSYYWGYCVEPEFNINGGYIEKNTEVTLKTDDGSIIYYTIDGSFPSKKSKKYNQPIKITNNTVIKAISYKDEYIESNYVSRTFIVGRKHDMAFVSISTNNLNFYKTYMDTKEQMMNLEFYEADGTLGTSFLGDIKVGGRSSSLLPQKSLSVYLRKRYGLKEVTYPFFNNDYHAYASLVFRNGGTDPSRLHIKDALLTQIVKDKMDLDMQDYRPVVVYLNGKYYGIYGLRNKINGDYFESYYDINKDDIDLFKRNQIKKGDNKDYNELLNYLKKNDVKKDEVYEYLETQIDIPELINYWITEVYYKNSDLLTNNVGFWKSSDGKWRWLLYDLDYAFESYETVGTFFLNRKPRYNNSCSIIVMLYQNEKFRDLYLTSLGKYLKEVFKPERVNEIIDKLVSEIEKEMPYHIKRWSGYDHIYGWDYIGSIGSWKNNINLLKKRLNNRYYEVVKSLKNGFKLNDNDYEKYFGGLS